MTDLRTAAQQALEAMSSFESGTNGLYEGEFAQEIAALRAALVEDAMQKFTDVNQELEAALAEPENWELRRLREELERCKQVCAATSEAWREEAALAEPVQEPVAYGCSVCGGTSLLCLHGQKDVPLYAAPLSCRNCASLEAQNTELDRKLAEMERKLLELQAAVLQSQGIRD